MQRQKSPALLVLENGSVYRGYSFGYEGETFGEVCFNTSMAGYQEIITDPSYRKQIVTLTYPMIGNYGIHSAYAQSDRIQAAGLIVKEYVDYPSNFVSEMSLGEYLKSQKVPAIERIETRKLVLELRRQGAMRGGFFLASDYDKSMLDKVRATQQMQGLDLASEVSRTAIEKFGSHDGKKFRIAVLDFGVKTNILRLLDQVGFAVDVLPSRTSFDELDSSGYDCYFLSNGPGDPEPVTYAIETARKLLECGKPIFGICLGHQIIGLASGRSTYKLKFGHRGGNQPVQFVETGKVEITAQNHGFAVSGEAEGTLRVSHINLNDRTIEGFFDREKSLITVQHHPEAAPGPNDSAHLFTDFYQMVESHYAARS